MPQSYVDFICVCCSQSSLLSLGNSSGNIVVRINYHPLDDIYLSLITVAKKSSELRNERIQLS